MDKLKNYQSVEKRRDFHKLPLILGKLDGTKETKQLLNKDMENWNKFAEYIILYLNSTQIDKTYAAIGEKTTSGNWSGLIGAIIAEDVDIVLDNIVKDPKMYSDIAFTQDIMVADRNIYLKPQQSNHVRDIFLTPFEPELLLYVILAGFLLAFVMALHLLTDLTNKYSLISKIYKYLQILSDASFCIIGIFTMQGTQIKPKSSSGKIIILISLLFSLVIYNSYSAFITSMLSVKLNKIRTVSDLLKSEDYQIGYTKNSEDENFLRTYNDTELNQIYLKGYLKNNINNITEGLLKATEGNYGFFASGYVARRQLLIISGYRCKYDITEIPALHTKNKIAFPMAPNSPYGKIINLCLIRMRESGIHQYVNSLIAPQLPKCDKKSSYQSARINDIVAAIGIFYVGVFFGGLIFVFECIWRNKKKIMYTVNRTCVFFNQNLEFVN